MPKRPTKTVEDELHDANEIIRKLRADVLDQSRTITQIRRENDTADAVRQEIWSLATYTPNRAEWTHKHDAASGTRGIPIVVWSDWHYGEIVDPEQIGGVNKFNMSVAKARATRLFDTIPELAYEHMGRAEAKYPGIIVCLGGDMLSGDIHEELAIHADRTPHQSVNDLTDIIAGGLEYMIRRFGRVYVPCTVGNHGRTTKKPRYKGRVFTNYDWNIYCNLEREFRKEKKYIKIDNPNSADIHFQSYNTRYMLTHGDDLGVKGGDGIIGAIGPIMRGSIKVGTQQQQIGQEVDHLVICHWHQTLFLPRCTVNNALKGPDEYSMLKLRAPASRPSQLMWFEHPDHGVTARWEIFLEGHKRAERNTAWVQWQD